MTDITTSLYILTGFVIVASVVAIEAKDLLSTVISVSAAGAGLSIIFLFLGAPDIAITQVVVEVICLVVLIRATVTRDDTTYDSHRDTFAVASGLVFVGVLSMFCYHAYRSMVPFGSPLMKVGTEYLKHGLERTGAANCVMAVLLDFRAYDTLGEATVIFAAVIGVYVLLRKSGRLPAGTKPGSEPKT